MSAFSVGIKQRSSVKPSWFATAEGLPQNSECHLSKLVSYQFVIINYNNSILCLFNSNRISKKI